MAAKRGRVTIVVAGWTVANEHIPIVQKSMWLFVVCSPLSDVLLLSVIVLDCVGLRDVGGPLSWACLGERFCKLVQIVRPTPVSSSLSESAICNRQFGRCPDLSSGCHHMLEGVPYCSSFVSSSRLQGVVAVVLFFRSGTLDGTLLDSADDTTHLVVFSSCAI